MSALPKVINMNILLSVVLIAMLLSNSNCLDENITSSTNPPSSNPPVELPANPVEAHMSTEKAAEETKSETTDKTVLVSKASTIDEIQSKINTQSTTQMLQNSKEINVDDFKFEFETIRGRSANEEESKKYKLVSEKIPDLKYNNSFVVYNMINSLGDKLNMSYMGEPFDFATIINANYSTIDLEGNNNKTFQFKNITSSINNSVVLDKTFKNTFTCTFSRELEMGMDMVPDNLILQGEYKILDHLAGSKQTNGTFIYKQQGGMLFYRIPYEEGIEVTNANLANYGDLVYEEGQVKLQRACENQCDLLVSSDFIYREVKLQVLKKINDSLVKKRIDQFEQAFPFLSTCLTPSSNSLHYFVVNNVSTIDGWRSKLLLGPMIIKGLDNYTWSWVMASKKKTDTKSTQFRVIVHTGHVLGQSDWKYSENDDKMSTKNYSFTFMIDQVDFNMSLIFKEKWYVNDLRVQIGDVFIHRLNKSHPKIHDFTKAILQEYVSETVEISLRQLFKQLLPTIEIKTTTIIGQSTSQSNQGISNNNTTANLLPVITRRAPAQCKKRSWWRRIIFFWRKSDC